MKDQNHYCELRSQEKGSLVDQEIIHIFTEIACGHGQHVAFVMSFAELVTRADPSNFDLVRPQALCLIAEYGLGKHLANFVST